jgi:hypothetical protein
MGTSSGWLRYRLTPSIVTVSMLPATPYLCLQALSYQTASTVIVLFS